MTEIQQNDENMFDKEDFVLMRKIGDDGKQEFISGGYRVNSFFLQGGMSALTTLNNEKQEGGKVSSPFENLAVPAGLFYVNQRVPKNDEKKQEHYYKQHETISDDMIDKLFGLVETNKKEKRKTRKNVVKRDKRKSRKQR